MIRAILYLFLLLSASFLSAQQEALYSQYAFNRLPFNPAFSGFNNNLQLTAAHRTQWAGLKGAPESQFVTLNRGYQNTPHGWGIVLGRTSQGIEERYEMSLSYGFELRFEKRSIYIGTQITGRNYAIDYGSPDIYATDGFIPDPLIERSRISSSLFNGGLGLLFKQNGFYAGVSITRLLEKGIQTGNEAISSEEKRHFYAMMGADIKLNDNWNYQPSALFKITENSPYNIDILTLFDYKDYLFLGMNIRSGGSGTAMLESMNILAGLQISKKVFGSISYDFTSSELRKIENGSIEVLLRYNFKTQALPEGKEVMVSEGTSIFKHSKLLNDTTKSDVPVDEKIKSRLDDTSSIFKIQKDNLLEGKLIVFNNINYASDSFTIEDERVEELDALAEFMINHNAIKVRLISYTDSRGEVDYNKRISNKQASEVKAYLVKKGLKAENILSIGMGESKIRNHCIDGVDCSKEEHSFNRRTEVQIIK